jgi:hypothetical protein
MVPLPSSARGGRGEADQRGHGLEDGAAPCEVGREFIWSSKERRDWARGCVEWPLPLGGRRSAVHSRMEMSATGARGWPASMVRRGSWPERRLGGSGCERFGRGRRRGLTESVRIGTTRRVACGLVAEGRSDRQHRTYIGRVCYEEFGLSQL